MMLLSQRYCKTTSRPYLWVVQQASPSNNPKSHKALWPNNLLNQPSLTRSFIDHRKTCPEWYRCKSKPHKSPRACWTCFSPSWYVSWYPTPSPYWSLYPFLFPRSLHPTYMVSSKFENLDRDREITVFPQPKAPDIAQVPPNTKGYIPLMTQRPVFNSLGTRRLLGNRIRILYWPKVTEHQMVGLFLRLVLHFHHHIIYQKGFLSVCSGCVNLLHSPIQVGWTQNVVRVNNLYSIGLGRVKKFKFPWLNASVCRPIQSLKGW